MTTVTGLAGALVRWQHGAGPFWPYVCAAPFLGGDLLAQKAMGTGARAARRSRGTAGLARHVLAGFDEADGDGLRALLLDLPPEPVLAAAPLLVERGWYVVPVVQRWIASPAVLPCRRLVERLVTGAWQARRPTAPRGVVLIADGERTGPVGYGASVAGRAFDNRYEYQICRFPSVNFLKAHGVTQVQWITAGRVSPAGPVRRDLTPYLEELVRAEIAVDTQRWPSL